MYKKIGNLGPHSDFISTFRGSGRFSGGKTVRKNRVRLVWHAIPPEACPPVRAFPHAPCSPPPLGSSCGPALPTRLRSGLLAARFFQPASARVFLRPGPSNPPPLGSSCSPVLPARLRSGLLAARPFQPASARIFLRPGPSNPPPLGSSCGPALPALPVRNGRSYPISPSRRNEKSPSRARIR